MITTLLPARGRVLALALAALAAAPLAAQTPAPDAPLPLDSAVRVGTLPNGMRFYIRPNAEPRSRAELRLVVNAGSVLEDADQRGVAHLLEHMAFNGTQNFRKQELVDYLERIGMRFGPDVNAYTSFDETVYMLTLPTDSAQLLETGFQILEDWAHGITLDSLEIEKERGVVIEEWRLGRGAGSRMQDRQFPLLVNRSRYAERLPIGTLESLQTVTPSAVRRFYRDWYRPELMAVVAVGDFDPARIEALVRQHFGELQTPEKPRTRSRFGVPEHEETVVSVSTDPEATGTSISLYFKDAPTEWRDVAAYRRWLAESLASGMLTSRLSERTHRPGAPYLDVSSYQGRFLHPLSVYMLSVRVPDRGVTRGLEELLLDLKRVDDHGFTAGELEREVREMLRRMEQRYLERDRATSGTFASDYASHFAYGGGLLSTEQEYGLHQRLLPRIDLAEVNRVVRRWIGEANRVVLVNAPRADSMRVPTEESLRSVLRGVRDQPVAPYSDSVSAAPLLRDPPEPGRVVAERFHPEVGVTEWTLGNGVRVLVKPTDYRPDEVLIAGRSPGGTSLVEEADLLAAQTASAVVQAGGLGELSSVELRKRLAGTMAGVGADISDLSEGVSGGASPRDLELLLQLVYLKFTAPRLDSAAVEAYREQARATLANRSANPEQVFLDTLRAVLTQHHPRARPLTRESFDSLDVRRSFEIYRERFADAGDFTFYLVGAVSPEEARPLVERYLGALPSGGRVDRPRDFGIRPPAGVVRRQVRRGLEPKSSTQIVFSGPVEFGREEIYALNTLAEVLQIRLREVLREEHGGTYGVAVRAGAARDPYPRYQLSIGYGSDPERAAELSRLVFTELERIRAEGPGAAELAKVREMELRARETDLRSNQFWITQMVSYDRHGWALPGILEYPDWLRSVDAARIQAAARRYLDLDSYVHATLLPGASVAGPMAPAPR